MDSKKRLIITSVISIILVSILFIGSTYSIFTSTDVDQESNVYQTGNLSIQFENTNNVALEITKPISDQKAVSLTPYHLTVTNNGTVAYKFNIVLNPTTATDEINHQYIMTKVGQLDSKKFSDCTNNIIKEGVILLPKTSVDIDVRVWLSDTVQNTEVNKSFSAKLSIDGVGVYSKHTEVDNSALASNDKLASRFSYDNSKSNFDCSDVQCAIDTLDKALGGNLFLGAYVSMTPKKSSYTTDTSKTGYTSTQTINPQELNLWRVIKINDDGTVEMISEHVSSTAVWFQGQTGYQNFVGYLNVLASQYENSTYTKGSRYFGYNGQTEYITDTSKFVNPAPWTSSTGSSTVESQGGGDELYTKDYNLVNTVLGTIVATEPNSKSGSYYWMASRYYGYSSSTSYGWYGRVINSSGTYSNYSLYLYSSSSFSTYDDCSSLRPIVVLKSGLKYSGLGTERLPMEISVS